MPYPVSLNRLLDSSDAPRDAWVEFLGSLPWDWIATLTFCDGAAQPETTIRLRSLVFTATRESRGPRLAQKKRASNVVKGGRSLYLEVASCSSTAGPLHHREAA